KDLEREIKQLEHDLSEKKNELLAFSEKVPIELEAKARRQLKNVEVPTGEKNWLGKPKMKTEKRPTENVVVSETDYKKLVSRSEERRVGKECRSRWWTEQEMKKRNRCERS